MEKIQPLRRFVKPAVAVAATALLAGCGDQETRPLTTWHPKGDQAHWINSLSVTIFVIAGIVGVLVMGIIGYVVIRFRRRPDDVDGVNEPKQIEGHNAAELTWTILPFVLLAVLAVFNIGTILKLPQVSKDALKVEVVGNQWWWEYRYHLDGDLNSDPEIITANQLVIPVDRDIRLAITSKDVIHSFWIPALNGKKDAVPGRSNKLVFHATETGIFEGTCTEFCGLSHAYMAMEVKALTPEEFDVWADAQKKPIDQTALSATAKEGLTEFQSRCAYCHQVNGLEEGSDGTPNPKYMGLKGDTAPPVRSQNAPNLTHLMSRRKFAGNLFNLYEEDGKTANVSELKKWVAHPDQMKPMNATTPTSVGNQQGMPNLGLDEATIDKLVAFLVELH